MSAARGLALAALCAASAACADAPSAPNADARARAAIAVAPPDQPLLREQWDQWVSVAAGGQHSCALAASGKVYCWGYNAFGQLGSAGKALRPRAIDSTGATFRAVSAGEDHSCALSAQGAAFCWGKGVGQTPTPVPRGLSFTAISVGGGEVCALSTSFGGSMWCWPFGGSPRLVQGAPAFASISVGFDQKCGITADGALYCWGANDYGQVGVGGATTSQAPLAIPRPNWGFWTDVSAGFHTTCARFQYYERPDLYHLYFRYHYSTRCWGQRSFERERDATSRWSTWDPAVWTGPSRLATGGNHACDTGTGATAFYGTLHCWGSNSSGQLGAGLPTGAASDSVGPVDGFYDQVSAGRLHTCALHVGHPASDSWPALPAESSSIWCWGSNAFGQLGNLTTTDSNVPVVALHPQSIAVLATP